MIRAAAALAVLALLAMPWWAPALFQMLVSP